MNLRRIFADLGGLVFQVVLHLSGFSFEPNESNNSVFRKLSEEIRKNPDNPQLYLTRVSSFSKFRPVIEQIADLSKIVEIVSGREEQYPNINIRLIYMRRSSLYRRLGARNFDNKELNEARECYKLAIEDLNKVYPLNENSNEQYRSELRKLQDALEEIDAVSK
jgi:tetratricopeptide (TPR) repeat protein